jgi:hypothetical protein
VSAAIPVLWITGPAGVGKSTVSWQLFTELAGAGVPVAFVDTDQLAMCYPAPPDDLGRERIKARNFAALLPGYALAGARCVVANGVLDPAIGLDKEAIPRADVLICRLRADLDELTDRFTGRYRREEDLGELLAQTLAEADGMEASGIGDVCADTSGLTANEVARLVRATCRDWPGFGDPVHLAVDADLAARSAEQAADPDPDPDADSGHPAPLPASADPGASRPADDKDGRVLLLCGPTGVGKSTIGFDVYLHSLRSGPTAGYVDLAQLGFVRPAPAGDPGGHRLKARNVGAMWRTFMASGARQLVVTGPVGGQAELECYLDVLRPSIVTVVRLHASRDELAERIRLRGEGGGWNEPGDPLRGQSAAFLDRVIDESVAQAEALERADVPMVRIDTSGRTAAESADVIATSILHNDVEH